MSDIDFQNGFLCGMATKGLTRSGEFYQPKVWNDTGVYNYFYIDFGRALDLFSIGMWAESILVYDSTQIAITAVEPVSTGIYKVWGDISLRYHGVTILNKKTSRLKFNNGQAVPVFSVHFFVAGIVAYPDAAYIYEESELNLSISSITEDTIINFDEGAIALNQITETVSLGIADVIGTVTEVSSLVLT